MGDRQTNDIYGQTRGLLAAVMDSCSDAIMACSLEGKVEAWNRGAEEIYGYASEEAIGSDATLTAPPERRGEIACLIEAAEAGRSVDGFDTVRTCKSGESLPIAVCGFPIHDDAGGVVGFATIERDVSERVRAADALRRALAEAQQASSAKSRFLANASHELRTPMNAIVGMTALALEERVSPELREYLETIRDSADSMVNLINDLLDLSKFEAENFELDETDFDPRELVEAAVRVLAPAAHAKGLELVCHVAPETPPSLVGDPVRLRQILTNLVGNAVKFTADGEVVVDVEPIRIEKRRCRLRISVTDTGIGVSREDQRRIFAPFTQVDGATTRRFGGTGLGLAITRHLVNCFEGELEIDSSPGEGSRFWFTLNLPLADAHETTAEQEAAERLRGLSVLVVDDNEASRCSLLEQFLAWEMHAEAVASGRAALERLTEAAQADQAFDLAVVDALMPGVDGFTVASKIDANPNLTTKPILLASTTDRLEFSRRCAEAGAAAFVHKPVSQSQLLGAVVQASGAATLDSVSKRGLFDPPRSNPRRVLLVEDTPANRTVVERVLEKRGHEVEAAVNGREAIDAFRRETYDLILMDVQMPIMDGYQATEAIREIEASSESPATPIIAMTAHSMRGDRERCLRAGMDAYLSKPLDLPQLIAVVEASDHAKPARLADRGSDEPRRHETPPVEPNRSVDLDSALSRLRGDRSLLLEMMAFYLEDSPALLQSVCGGAESGDWATVQRSAHSLKGLAATFDAHSVVAAARDVEIAARNGDAENLPAKLRHLREENAWLTTYVTEYREKNARQRGGRRA